MGIRLELTTDNLIPAFRATVSALLSEKNMSISEYSAKSGVSEQTIENLLSGKSKSIKPDTMIKLIRGFDMPYNDFTALVLSHSESSDVG